MSKQLKNALHKLTHHDNKDSKHGTAAGSGQGSGTTTPELAAAGGATSGTTSVHSNSNSNQTTLAHVNSDLNSPLSSGANTPVHSHDGAAVGARSSLDNGSGGHKSGGLHWPGTKKDKKHGEHEKDGGDLDRAQNTKCSDLHEHFLAVKAASLGGGKKQHDKDPVDGHGSLPNRPGMVHAQTEEDTRALKVDRQMELQQEQLKRELAYKEAYENDPHNRNYGFLNIDATPNAGVDTSGKKDNFLDIAKRNEGDEVYFRARIQSVRHQSAKLAFVIFRQRYQELQGVLALEQGHISENMVRFVERLPQETIVLVRAIVQDPHAHGQSDIHYTTIHNVEVKIRTLHVVSQVTTSPPFNIHDAARPESDFHQDEHHAGNQVSARMHFGNRVASLRTPVSQAIFQLRAAICFYFRSYLTERHFTEIQSSKFQQGAPESGASVFKVDYFKRPISLAQSPQLAKQMCIAGDMERVFEIGPVFRAENSQTARHLTEFIGMDLEMTIDHDYHEVIDMLDGMFINLFQNLQKNQHELINVVRRQFPSQDIVIPDKTVRLTFKEAVALLNDSGWREDGEMISEYEDFSTPTEKHLGKLVKEKYNTDYYIVDKFPASARPFYTMPDPHDARISNSADFFLRGQEILSGGQRIHHAPLLEEKMKAAKIDPKEMEDYLNGFRWGCPPHGGGGIGLERVLFLFLELGNVRWASLFPRDPRSFPEDKTPHGGKSIRGPEVNLLDWDVARRRGEDVPLPSVEDLIASYGDAANTVYLDPSWEVWRDEQTGAACGFKESEGYAISWGRPLCDDKQLKGVITRYLAYFKKERKLKPIFACIDETSEQIMAKEFDWRSLAVAAEERIDPTSHNPNNQSTRSNLGKKITQAKNGGVKAVTCEGLPDEKIRKEIDQRMEEWRGSREGKQMHTTSLLPWDDHEHRKYFYATDKQGKVVALVTLAQLAPVHGFQIKYSLSFPNGPPGAIELLLSTAIDALGAAGCHSATFGTSAATHLGEGSHQSALKMKTLSKAYDAITSSFHLLSKPEFRAKFGTEQDPVYISYPKHGGLGVGGIHAVVKGLSE